MAELTLVIKGSDETKAAFADVQGGLQDVGETAESAGQQGGGFFSNMLSTASGFLAANVVGAIAGQFTSFVSSGISDAREANKLMATTEQLIKTTGGAAGMSAEQVADLASSLSAAAGKSLFGDDQIQGAENVLIKFKELKGIVPDVTRLSVDMAQALGGEPAAAAEGLARAFAKPEEAAGRLAKMGVILTDQQQDQIKAMVAAGDTAGAQAVLMEQLNGVYGGQAEAAAKADGGMAQFKDRLGEAGETIGAALIPAIDKLTGLASDYLIPVIEEAATWLGENLPGAIDTVTTAFGTIGGIIDTVIGAFSAGGESSDALSGTLGELGGIWEQVEAIIGVAVELIDATVVPIFMEIAGFLAAHSEEILGILSGVWTMIQGVIQVTLAIIKGVISTVLAVIHGDWEGAWTAIETMFSGVWDGIQTILSGALEVAKNELSMAWDAIKGTVTDAWDGITGAVSDALDSLVDTIMGLPDRVADVGNNLVAGIKSGFQSSWDSFVNWVIGQLDGLKDEVLSFFGINSPSTMFAEIGTNLVAGLMVGIDDMIPDLMDGIDVLTASLRDAMEDATGEVAAGIQAQIDAIEDAASNLGKRVSDAVAGAFDATASIERQKEKNLAALDKYGKDLQDAVSAQLDQADAEAGKIADPEQSKAYFALRSKQILETADLEQQQSKATTNEERIRLNERMTLLKHAHDAELAALAERQSQGSTTSALTGDLNTILAQLGSTNPALSAELSALLTKLGLAGGTSNATPILNQPPPMTGNEGFARSTTGAPQQQFVFHVDARGSTMRPEEFRRIAEDVVTKASQQADIRQRTR
jgi:hypothetical protein